MKIGTFHRVQLGMAHRALQPTPKEETLYLYGTSSTALYQIRRFWQESLQQAGHGHPAPGGGPAVL